MTLSQLSVKYFTLSVGKIKKKSPSSISCDCPLCGDKKGRLSITAVKDEDGVLGCFNAGCILNDNAMPLIKALEFLNPRVISQYKTEKFNKNMDGLKDDTNKLPSLDSILQGVKEKKTVKIKPKVDIVESIAKKPVLSIPKFLTDSLYYAKDIKNAVTYLNNRGIEFQDNWMFSKAKFINIFEKDYFVENFLFIPLFQEQKLRGFYTRSITEKRFSTILFPRGERYWQNDTFNPDKTCYVFEGIFDALSSGLDNVMAMLGADLSDEILEELKDIVFCFDNDKSGYDKATKYNEMGYKTFIWPEASEKDMNESAVNNGVAYNKDMILDNIYSGIEAKIRIEINKWR